MTPDYGSLLDRYADIYGVPRNVAHALMHQESGGNAGALSSAGARGLMQVMPGTAAQYGVSAAQLADPETNIRTGLHYFSDMLRHTQGDLPGALISYNAGPGWYDKLHAGHIGFEALPAETQSYVPSVLARAGLAPHYTPAASPFAPAPRQTQASSPSLLAPASSASAFAPFASPGYTAAPAQAAIPQTKGLSYGESTADSSDRDRTGSVFDPTGADTGPSFGRFGFGRRSPYDATSSLARTFADILRG